MVDRRGFLGGSLAAAGAALIGGNAVTAGTGNAVAGSQPSKVASVSSGIPDIAVVGAGAFGGWTALSLQEKGAAVVSIDAFGAGNPRASSGGETRSIRSGYGAEAFYAGWSIKALELWKLREQEFGQQLFYPTDRIEMAQVWSPHLTAQKAVFDEQKIPYRILSQSDLRDRWPQMNFDDVEFAFYETPATAGLLRARESLLLASKVFQRKGGRYEVGNAMPAQRSGRTLNTVDMGNGKKLSAGQFVFAVGPWSPKVFPEHMARKVSIRRGEYYYWGLPAGDARFSWPSQPIWHDEIWGGFGFPSIERGLKYAPSGSTRPEIDPDVMERLPDPERIANGHRYIGHRFPAMRRAPIVETRVCQYEGTRDQNFIIDRHPDYDNVWLASGGGGHGYKFGPLLGEYISDRVLGVNDDPVLAERFSWAGRPDIA